MSAPYPDQRTAALALLNCGCRLTRKAGSFLGQLCADDTPMSPAQHEWISTLLDRAGLPAIGGSHV